MLVEFWSWWRARIAELLPIGGGDAGGAPDGVVIDMRDADITASIRRKGREQPIGLGMAARSAGRTRVLLRPAAETVLEKQYTVPAAGRRDMEDLLRHDLVRITPFTADALFWRWDAKPKPGDRSRTDVVLTMVPKISLAGTLDRLNAAGITPGFLEVTSGGRRRLLPIGGANGGHSHREWLARGLWAMCGTLALVALLLPFVLQSLALNRLDAEIMALRPAVTEAETMRRTLTAGNAAHEVLAREMERTGDALQVLATLTRVLPDDTYLTDFALRDRHLTISGRSASAPRLIGGLAAEPGIRDAAFSAPVTRIEGSAADVFSIAAEAGP